MVLLRKLSRKLEPGFANLSLKFTTLCKLTATVTRAGETSLALESMIKLVSDNLLPRVRTKVGKPRELTLLLFLSANAMCKGKPGPPVSKPVNVMTGMVSGL